MNVFVSGVGVSENAIQNSPCVKTVISTLKRIVALSGKAVASPKSPCFLKLLCPKSRPLLEVLIPKAGTLARLHSVLDPLAVKVSSLDMICQRSKQSSGGVTGVGCGVSVGAARVKVTVGASLGGTALHVAVGGGRVAIVSMLGLLVGGGACCRAFNMSVPVTISVVMIEPITVMSAVKTAGLEKTLFCCVGRFSLLIVIALVENGHLLNLNSG